MTSDRVRKAVIPAAGLGTRFLPATKSIPKEMIPVVDKPVIQYAVEECLASGIEHIIIVTGRGKSAMEDYFDAAPELESVLAAKGKTELAALVRNLGNMAQISYTRQHQARGLGHAVLTAKALVGDEPFAVLLPDVIIQSARAATRQLVDVYEATRQGTIAVDAVPMDQIHLYGVVRPAGTKSKAGSPAASTAKLPAEMRERLTAIEDLVEKPRREEAPSDLSVTGRYVLPPEIFAYLEKTQPGRGGEIQLTDGMRLLAKEKGLWAYRYEGMAYDAGDKLGFLKATVQFALMNKELGPAFGEYLKKLKL
jgi:UTP--glucose-1-phosphate uridylyltransferase